MYVVKNNYSIMKKNANVNEIQKPTKEDIKKAFSEVEDIKKRQKNIKPEPVLVSELPKSTPKRKKKESPKIEKRVRPKNLGETTIRDLSNGDKSILEDLGILEKQREKERILREEDIKRNKRYGFDVPFINEMMTNFNAYLNDEEKKFISQAEESMKQEDKEDENSNIYIKLIIVNEKERILFKELLLSTDRYPIHINIGDYDFFFECFDKGIDPIFSFDRSSFNIFFSNNIESFKEYVKKNKIEFGIRYDQKIVLDDLKVEIVKKETPDKKEEKETVKEEPKNEIKEEPKKEEIKPNDVKADTKSEIIIKKAYKIQLLGEEKRLLIITDDPAEIFNRFSTERVLSIKLVGSGVCI
jgi:hypothetical protein